MNLSELKPILTVLVLPPGGPLLLLLLGLLWATRRRGTGLFLAFLALLSLWFLSCSAVGVLLARQLLPQFPPAQPAQLQKVQAIVILGGGVEQEAPEYGVPQPGAHTLQRVRYGAWLARRSGKPLGFAGGVGWAAAGTGAETEGTVARRLLQDEYGLPLRWMDDRSRDTRENALRMAELLLPANVRHIALVTDATHMPRAAGHFRAVGFTVLPAPTAFPTAGSRPVLQWLPSPAGLQLSTQVLREWLGNR
ncbi:MAG: YdcF family protein, partial [Ramlibacter sp.]